MINTCHIFLLHFIATEDGNFFYFKMNYDDFACLHMSHQTRLNSNMTYVDKQWLTATSVARLNTWLHWSISMNKVLFWSLENALHDLKSMVISKLPSYAKFSLSACKITSVTDRCHTSFVNWIVLIGPISLIKKTHIFTH